MGAFGKVLILWGADLGGLGEIARGAYIWRVLAFCDIGGDISENRFSPERGEVKGVDKNSFCD